MMTLLGIIAIAIGVALLVVFAQPIITGFIVLIVIAGTVHQCSQSDNVLSPFKAAAFATKNCGLGDAFTNTCAMSPEDQRAKLFIRDPIDNGRTVRVEPEDRPLLTRLNERVVKFFHTGEDQPVAGVDYQVQNLSLDQKAQIFRKVCKENGLDRECWEWLTALCLHEGDGCRQDAFYPEPLARDGFASHGPFQIRVRLHQEASPPPLNNVDIQCAYDYECGARWTLKELRFYGYPNQVVGSICHHNGATGSGCNRYYNKIVSQRESLKRLL